MKKLESRPILGKPWEYSFFMDLEINDRSDVEKVLPLLRDKVSSMRVLGYYTKAR